MSKLYEGKTRVNYYDLDLWGNIKLSALLRMVHIAADINANELGIGYQALSAENMSFVLQRFGLSIMRMPVYSENVTIRTWPANISRGTFIRQGDMYDAKGQKIMEWSSMWLLFDIAARKILRPSSLPVSIERALDQSITVQPEKINISHEFGEPFFSFTHVVRYADVDTNMHMNNSVYGDLIGNAFFSAAQAKQHTDWKHVQINFLSETLLGEEVGIFAYREDDMFLIVGETPGRMVFTARIS